MLYIYGIHSSGSSKCHYWDIEDDCDFSDDDDIADHKFSPVKKFEIVNDNSSDTEEVEVVILQGIG